MTSAVAVRSVSALLIGLGLLFPWLMRALSPEWATTVAYVSGAVPFGVPEGTLAPRSSRDPWNRPWCREQTVTYSTGPNGVDELGQGDDIVPNADSLHSPLPVLVLWVPRWMVAVAVGVLLGTAMYAVRPKGRGSKWVKELVAVAVPPIPVFLVGAWTVSWLEARPWLGSLTFISGWSQSRLTLAFGLAVLSYAIRQLLVAGGWRRTPPKPPRKGEPQ